MGLKKYRIIRTEEVDQLRGFRVGDIVMGKSSMFQGDAIAIDGTSYFLWASQLKEIGKFDVGEKVVVVSNTHTKSESENMGRHYFPIGTVGVVGEHYGHNGYYKITHEDGSDFWFVHEKDMKLYEEEKDMGTESTKMDGWLVVELTDMEVQFNLTEEQALECVQKHIALGYDSENILVFAPNSNTVFENSIKFRD